MPEPTLFRDRDGLLRYWILWVGGILIAAILIGGIAFGWNIYATKREQHKSERGRGDAPRPTTEQIDGRPVDGVTEFPDAYSNVATKCVWDGYRGFMTTRSGTDNSAHLVVVEDPECEHVGTGPDYDGDLTDVDDG